MQTCPSRKVALPRKATLPRRTIVPGKAIALSWNLARLAALSLAMLLVLQLVALPVPAAEAASTPRKLFLGYWAKWGDEWQPEASLTANLSRIDLFSPYWYTLRSDGSLGSRESGRAALTDKVHAAGQKVIPLINKTSDNTPLLDPTVRRRAVENIYQLLVDNGYDGVNIDFEGMPSWTRSGLTAFMQELAAKLRPAGLLVTMAVPAKWSSDDSINDFAACFDYAALGQAVDYLVIMTYDQHASWSGPGPVAGLDWVDKVVRYATTVVPANKILLGLAGYGYDWSAGGCSNVEAWSAPEKAARYGAEIQWDDTAQVPHFTYWTSSGTRHDVWYENSYSVDYKIALTNEYNLGGVALWALGMEDSRFWQVVRGTAGFSGGLGAAACSGSGAGGSGPSGAGGVSPGGSGGSWGSTGGGSTGTGASGQVFADVPASYWAYGAIAGLAATGAVNGVDGNRFEPDRPISRAEFAAILARALNLPAPPVSVSAFRDVASTDWFYDAVIRAVGSGYMVGIGGGLFGPDFHLTRQEAAAILVRIVTSRAVQSAAGSGPASFTDTSSAAGWAMAAIKQVAQKGLMNGYPDGSFQPLRDVTRAEAAVLISRLAP